MTQPPTGPRDQYSAPPQYQPGLGPAAPRPAEPHNPGPLSQVFYGADGPSGPAQRGPRSARPPATVLAPVVALLGLASIIWGFLPSSKLTHTTDDPLPLGSVFAVVGWAPALLLLSGLLAAGTLLAGIDRKTMWLASAASAVAGGLGSLFFLLGRPGRAAGLGFAMANGSASESYGESVSVGLILLVVFGLFQLVAAVIGFLTVSGSTNAGSRRSGYPAPDRQSVGQQYGRPPADQGPAVPSAPTVPPGPYGPPPQPLAGMPPHFYAQARFPERPDPGQYPPAYSPSTPTQQVPGAAGGRTWDGQPPGAPSAPPIAPPRRVFDPQTGSAVQTGLTEPTPIQYAGPPPPPMTNTALGPPPNMTPSTSPPPAVGWPRPEPEDSQDYPSEPAYSEAPDYEERAEQEAAEAAQERERRAFLYETPEWERPQFEPPQIDSGRHPGWYPQVEGESPDPADRRDPGDGTTSPPSGWRSIPRAE